ncbi:ATP-binding cassette domain-containing protein [Haloarculaceae archaeon H-GB11]|nr:ATP-binding cassette domain-containing protein [Haloarculaceae archaeon H-GB11]
MTTSEPLLEARDLRKTFGGLTAVDDVSFTVDRGTIVGLIGPNGAGKSTTFNLVTGFYDLDDGEVRLRGENVADLSPEERSQKGMVRTFQITRELTGMKVRENMHLGDRTTTARRSCTHSRVHPPRANARKNWRRGRRTYSKRSACGSFATSTPATSPAASENCSSSVAR